MHFSARFFSVIIPKPQHLVVKSYFFLSEPQYVIRTTASTWLELMELMFMGHFYSICSWKISIVFSVIF